LLIIRTLVNKASPAQLDLSCPILFIQITEESFFDFGKKRRKKTYFGNYEVTLDRESIASQCMDIHKNPGISKFISIKAWISKD